MLFLTFLLLYNLSQAVSWEYQQSVSNRIQPQTLLHMWLGTSVLFPVLSTSGEGWSAFDSYSPKILCPTSHTEHEVGWKYLLRPAFSKSKSLASPHWRLTPFGWRQVLESWISLTQWFMWHFPYWFQMQALTRRKIQPGTS